MAAKKTRKEVVMVKPSKLPKDTTTTVRVNSFVKQRLKEEGLSIQKLLDDAIDRKLYKVEFEQKLTIETKANIKKN